MNEKLEALNQEIEKTEKKLQRAQHEEKMLEHQINPFIGESRSLGDRRGVARLPESGWRNGYGVCTDGYAPAGYGETSFGNRLQSGIG